MDADGRLMGSKTNLRGVYIISENQDSQREKQLTTNTLTLLYGSQPPLGRWLPLVPGRLAPKRHTLYMLNRDDKRMGGGGSSKGHGHLIAEELPSRVEDDCDLLESFQQSEGQDAIRGIWPAPQR